MANHALAQHANAQQHCIPIAVGGRSNHLETVAGAFAFGPEFLPGAAVEGHESGAQLHFQRLLVHEAQHQQLPATLVLNDGRDQTLHLVEVDFHRFSYISATNFEVSPKAKARWGEFCASGLGSYKCLVIRVPPPTRSSHVNDGDEDGSARSLQSDGRAVEIPLSIDLWTKWIAAEDKNIFAHGSWCILRGGLLFYRPGQTERREAPRGSSGE